MPRPPRKTPRATPAALRREVERLRARLKAAERRADRSNLECARAVQELDVYKEEVRHQTDELLSTQHALEASRDRYAVLYDFAPVAYLTLDRNGLIEELNLPAAHMLGVDRPRVLKMPLLSFVAREDRKAYMKHLLHCRRGAGHVTSEIHLRPRGDAQPLPVLMSTWAGAPPRDAAPPATPGGVAGGIAGGITGGFGAGWQRRDGSAGSGPAARGGATASAHTEFRTALLDLTDRRRAEQQEVVYQHRLRSLATELSLAEERERRRIAVEIHDQISQALAMAKMKLDGTGHRAVVPEVKQAIAEVSQLVGEVLGHTRSLTFELSPPVLHELGFEPALEWLAERTQQQYHLRVEVDTPRLPLHLPHELAVLLFQATRELLINVVKHADAARAVVRVRRTDGHAQVIVEDDGRGFPPERRAHPGAAADGDGKVGKDGTKTRDRDTGFGLFSIRTRLEHLGGAMTAESPPGGGSRVTLTVPLAAPGDAPHAGARQENRRPKIDVDGSGPAGNDGASTARLTNPGTPEGPDDESATRRRPPHRARRPQKPPVEPA